MSMLAQLLAKQSAELSSAWGFSVKLFWTIIKSKQHACCSNIPVSLAANQQQQ